MFAAPCQENCVTLGVGEQTAGISGMVVERKKRKRKRPCTVQCNVCLTRCAACPARRHPRDAELALFMPNMSYDSHDFLHVCIPRYIKSNLPFSEIPQLWVC